jgi:putative hydrolase of HD superfamily
VNNARLAQQIAFITEADKLKTVLRKTKLINGERLENSAEHSWHFALMALTLTEHAATGIDTYRVIRMALLHDLVEIDAGDSFVYDAAAMEGKAEREQAAADRIFGMLPADQAESFRALWDEFEEQQTPEAKFAAAIDRLCGMLPNYKNQGGSWKEHGISATRVTARNAPIADGSSTLWEMASQWIQEATERGWIHRESAG